MNTLLAEAPTVTIDTAAIETALKAGFGAIQGAVTSVMTSAAPFALGILGVSLAITIGIGFFKKVTSKA